MKEYQKDCWWSLNLFPPTPKKKSIHKVFFFFFAKIRKSFWESNGNKLSDQGIVLRKQGDFFFLKKKKK